MAAVAVVKHRAEVTAEGFSVFWGEGRIRCYAMPGIRMLDGIGERKVIDERVQAS